MDNRVRLVFGGGRMSKPVPPSPLPPRRRWSRRRRLGIIALVLLACWGIYRVTHPPPPSVRLPDGTKITFHSVSRGKPAGVSGNGVAMFQHEAFTNDSAARRAWHSFRDNIPSWMSSNLSDWSLGPDFSGGHSKDEFELRFLMEGGLQGYQWGLGIADDGGWDTDIGVVGMYNGGFTPATSSSPLGALWMPCPLPRHSQQLRIRFYAAGRNQPDMTLTPERKIVAEMVIPNPYYEGPAPPSSAPAAPVTKATRFGDLTLTRFERRHLAGSEFGGTFMEFQLLQGGKPVTKMSFDCEPITDRSGQWFRWRGEMMEGEEKGLYRVEFRSAPWSDDPVWRCKVKLQRGDYCEAVDESEIFHFDHLPVPQGTRTEVYRSITRNGTSLHIHTIERSDLYGWRFYIQGWPPAYVGGEHRILLQDVRDDRGRTYVETENGTVRLVRGPRRAQPEGQVYLLRLPPDTRWWDLKVVPETVETVEFEARPTFIK